VALIPFFASPPPPPLPLSPSLPPSLSLTHSLSLSPSLSLSQTQTHTHTHTHTHTRARAVGWMGMRRGAPNTGYYGGRATRALPCAPRTSASRSVQSSPPSGPNPRGPPPPPLRRRPACLPPPPHGAHGTCTSSVPHPVHAYWMRAACVTASCTRSKMKLLCTLLCTLARTRQSPVTLCASQVLSRAHASRRVWSACVTPEALVELCHHRAVESCSDALTEPTEPCDAQTELTELSRARGPPLLFTYARTR
jgi:hypothetical protein